MISRTTRKPFTMKPPRETTTTEEPVQCYGGDLTEGDDNNGDEMDNDKYDCTSSSSSSSNDNDDYDSSPSPDVSLDTRSNFQSSQSGRVKKVPDPTRDDTDDDGDDDEEGCPKKPRLDEDLVTDWYSGPSFRQCDKLLCNEYFLRGRNLFRCFQYLREGLDFTPRHAHRLSRTLHAGKHSSSNTSSVHQHQQQQQHRIKIHSDYVKMARAEYEALVVILYRQDGALMNKYLLAALVTVHTSKIPVLHVRLMEVTLLLLREEREGVEDLRAVVDICRHVEYGTMWRFARRPSCEVMIGVVHNLLYHMTHADLQATLHRRHKCIYQLACAPLFGLIGYHGAPPLSHTATLYNNTAKIFHDYFGDEAQSLLLVSFHASLVSCTLGQLSDLFLDRVARAVKTVPPPPGILRHLEHHIQTTDTRPGPGGCVAMLRILRRCHKQLKQLRDFPALLRRLLTLLVACSDRPLTVARDLGRLLSLLRKERSTLLHGTIKAGKDRIKKHLHRDEVEAVSGEPEEMKEKEEVEDQYFLVDLIRLVIVAARAVSLPPVTCSTSDYDSEPDSENPDEPEIKSPPMEEVVATLMGLCGRQAEPRASWSSLACEVSHLLLHDDSPPQDCHVVDTLVHLAMCLEDGHVHHHQQQQQENNNTKKEDND